MSFKDLASRMRFYAVIASVIFVALASMTVVSAAQAGCPTADPSGEKVFLSEGTVLNGWICTAGGWAPEGHEGQEEVVAESPVETQESGDFSSNAPISECNLVAPSGDLNDWLKTTIELVPGNTWFHRVFDVRQFRAPNWGGADSWFVSLNIGPNSGGYWTSFGNPGQVVYRAEQTSVSWCLGVFTTSEWKSQFMGSADMPAAINIRVLKDTLVYVRTVDGTVVSQPTSDGGDLTVTLPDDGYITIWTSFVTAAPTFESTLHWGPQDRTAGINILDASGGSAG